TTPVDLRAATVDLNAATGIGLTSFDLFVDAANLSADTASGGIFVLANTSGPMHVTSLSTLAAGGNGVEFDQYGTGDTTIDSASAVNGYIE
ncbi:hypothetical protein N4G37_13645, partial [Enterococcus faecalis]|uniref:hypothetical protein n=1 Tax=Enterococcus faecalis TaxID=1351 RepID=UPI0021B0F153